MKRSRFYARPGVHDGSTEVRAVWFFPNTTGVHMLLVRNRDEEPHRNAIYAYLRFPLYAFCRGTPWGALGQGKPSPYRTWHGHPARDVHGQDGHATPWVAAMPHCATPTVAVNGRLGAHSYPAARSSEFAGQAPGRHARPLRSLLEADGDIPVNRDLIVPVSEFAHDFDGAKRAVTSGEC